MCSHSQFEEHPELGNYVTPREAKTKPVYNWFVYPHSFSPTLIWTLVNRFKLTNKDRVLDPFVGAGTTILAAKEKNISATGLDLLPISKVLTRVKITEYNLEELEKDVKNVCFLLANNAFTDPEEDALIKIARTPRSIIGKAFSHKSINKIVQIKRVIREIASSQENHDFLLVGLLAILEECSFTLKAGGWLKIVEQPRNNQNLEEVFLSRLERMYQDIVEFQKLHYQGEWCVEIGDAREVYPKLGSFQAIISSPPYLNRHDYTRVLSLELLTGFLNSYEEITPLRYNLLRSHVEAKPKSKPPGYKQPQQLTKVLAELTERKTDPRVLYIIEGYFEDMFLVLKASRQYLVDNGYMALILGNVRFSGIPVQVDEIIVELGKSIGLSWETTLVTRRRNNSAQQMRDFGRNPSRESIIIWRAV